MIKKRQNPVFASEKFKDLLKNCKVKRIAIFGSCAADGNQKGSDVDFLVEFQKDADLLDQVGLKLALEKLLHKAVDVVTPRALSKYIRRRVMQEAVYL